MVHLLRYDQVRIIQVYIVKRRAWMENNDQIGGGVFVTTPVMWSLFSVKTNFIPSLFSTPFSE